MGDASLSAKPPSPAIVISSGEPAGIGPDICLAAALEALPARIAVLADPELLEQRAADLDIGVELIAADGCKRIGPHVPGRLHVIPVRLRSPVQAGQLDPSNAEYVLELLRQGIELCQRGESAALVTAPVQKSVINAAGIPFSGHTEFLAELTSSAHPVMLLAGPSLRVALATTHVPLRRVAEALTSADLEQTLRVLSHDLRTKFGIVEPRILVLGLNPHAGESGVLGDEEQRIIEPAIAAARARGLSITGPVPADTAFSRESLQRCDVVLAMYHDQGLPVLKALDFGQIVNITLGLPIIRTSVDHGTALDLAGTGRASHASLLEALRVACRLAAAGAHR